MRRRRAPERIVLPDPKYKSELVSKFINGLILEGNKSKAEIIFYTAMDLIEQKLKQDPLVVFKKAMDNVAPILEVRSRRVGGATYQIPVEVREHRRRSLAIRWLVSYSRDRSERTMSERLANEIMAAFKNEGSAVKKKEDTHKMAEANKAFAHFRW
ncbi:MAG: 30S ribosomal protein S7 [Caldithrix sp. RBG_13_44_9]|nr:MAG: 30S ribosomal protein S7 [Caldithrix sp. RBG_13_44_9]